MQITEEIVLRGIIFILSFCGFLICRHIHTEKKEARPLVCPMNFNCQSVVHSDYSKFLGISLEVFGMFYYAVVSLLYLVLVFVSIPLLPTLSMSFALLAIGAFLFSIYLTLVQLFILREGCFWCFISAGISFIVFIIAIFLYDLIPVFKSLMS